MCLLTYFPPMAEVNTARLECGAECNPHGHGFAIVTPDGEVIVDHAMRPDELIERFATLRRLYPDSHALFHSRITTHGTTSLENCHPFTVVGPRGGQTILAHNGILPTDCQPRKGDSRSDTRILAEDMLWKRWSRFAIPAAYSRRGKRTYTRQWLDSALVRADIEKWLGTGSKVLVLTTSPRLSRTAYLFNERLGEWVDGVWYSNGSYERYTSPYSGIGYTWTNGSFRVARHAPRAQTVATVHWWDDIEPFTSSTNEGLDPGPTRQGQLWEGRRWYPNQSYLHHFHARACDICDGRNINRQDYVCDTCGVCWICNNWFTDCDKDDQGRPCGRSIEVREVFDRAVGYVWVPVPEARALTARPADTVVKSAAESAAVFQEAINADQH